MRVYETNSIRNVALLGHGGVGKTTLVEAMLYVAGKTNRLGRVETGNTVSDFDQEEIKRHISIHTSLVPVEWKDYKINVLDTPGYFDFVGSVKEAMSVADSALIVVKASAGLEVGTEKAWEYAEEANVPRIIFVSEMDAPNVDMGLLVSQFKEKFGSSIAPVQVPWYENGRFVGYVHVLKMIGRRFEAGKVVDCPIPETLQEETNALRGIILEAVAETDEILMEKYFAEEELTQQEIETAFKKGVLEGQIVPVLCGSSLNGTGISVLMDTIITLFPAPNEIKNTLAIPKQTPKGTGLSSVSLSLGTGLEESEVEGTGLDNRVEILCDKNEMTSLFIFKTIVDPFIGKFSLFKVKSGTVKTEDAMVNVTTGDVEKLSHLYILTGKEQEEVTQLYAGDIGAVAKLKTPKTSDTLAEKGFDKYYHPIIFPKAYVKMAIFPAGKGDEEKMSTSLYKLMAEDNTFTVEYDKETHETIVCGIGSQQLDVIVSTLKNKFKVDVNLQNPTTPYRETIKGKVNIRGKHKKQSGGHGQYGDVVMEFEPSGDLEMPYVFEEKVFGGSVPKQYFPAIEKGLDECVNRGVLAGYPVVGVKAVLLDGSYHPVDSSEMAFKMATTIAFKEGIIKASPTLLEPIAHVEITVPEEYTGDIMGDMKKRRGRMIGMDLKGKKQIIIAEVPMAELYSYATDVRSMTQGRGEIDYYFTRYEEAPGDIQQKVISTKTS